MGATARATEITRMDGTLPLVIFVISAPVAVIGIPQLMEARAERRKRGVPVLLARGDAYRRYLPVWGRMFVWFGSSIATVLTMKAMGE